MVRSQKWVTRKRMDKKQLVRKSNLEYSGTVERCEEGLPVGNGTMGTLIWTSPASLKMAINRVDVFASGNASNSFFEPHEDYAYACGFVDIDFAGFGGDVFDDSTTQELDLYEARATIKSHGITADCFLSANEDVLAMHISDVRANPEGIVVRLRMLRNSIVRHRSHVAASAFRRVGDTAVLLQEFIEDGYYCASAVAIKVDHRKTTLRIDNENNGSSPILPPQHVREIGRDSETEMRIMLAPQNGEFDLYITSATTMVKGVDVVGMAAETAERAARKGYQDMLVRHSAWWRDFWDKSYISVWGTDEAEEASVHYTYFFYIMGCCSRNDRYAPNFGGMNLSPRGDPRHWGAMQWWNNLNLYYNAILPSGHHELIEPYYNMYFNMYAASETAARQVWGAEGIYIGETSYVWGPEVLPDDIADEIRELMLLQKPWSERSENLMKFASRKNAFEPRWNWMIGKSTRPEWVDGELHFQETEYGPFSYVSHIFGSMADLAYQYWLSYEYTGDEAFLREKAYPMLRGVTEFFRTYPNLVKEDDGRYHILYTHHQEGFWGGKDTLDTLTGMHGALRTTIHAARLLGADKDKVPLWEELLAHMAPLPTSKDTDCLACIPENGSEIFVGARGHGVASEREHVAPHPCMYYDFCNLQTEHVDPELYRIGRNTLDHLKMNYTKQSVLFCREMSPYPRIFAAMGEGDMLCDNVIQQIRAKMASSEHCYYKENGSKSVYRNRLTAREGINALSAQRLGNAAAGIQMGLLQCSGGAPALPPVIRVFPAWKPEWSAEFELHARGGFMVSARQDHGEIEYVRIRATRDAHLSFINPWNRECTAYISGKEISCPSRQIDLDLKAGEETVFKAAFSREG